MRYGVAFHDDLLRSNRLSLWNGASSSDEVDCPVAMSRHEWIDLLIDWANQADVATSTDRDSNSLSASSCSGLSPSPSVPIPQRLRML